MLFDNTKKQFLIIIIAVSVLGTFASEDCLVFEDSDVYFICVYYNYNYIKNYI